MSRDVLPVVFDGHNDVLERLGAPEGADPAHSSSEARGVTWSFPGRGREALGAVSSPSESPSPKSRPGQRAPGEPPPAIDPGYALSYSLAAIATLFRIEDLSDGKFRTVRTAADIGNSASRKDACSFEALGGRHATHLLDSEVWIIAVLCPRLRA